MSAKRRRHLERQRRRRRASAQISWAPPGGLHEVDEVDRLAYSRRQAADALGVSVSTVDRRLVPAVSTVKTPWGQRLIPVAELERFLREHVERPHDRGEPGRAGRRPTLPEQIVARIRLDYARGCSLRAIADALNNDDVPTAHGGRRWWPSTVRAVLVRSSPSKPAETMP